MEVDGLAAEWDASEAVRAQVRLNKKLFHHPTTQKWCEPTRANCVENSAVLTPLLARLHNTDTWKLPYLETLQVEIALLFKRIGIDVEQSVIYTGSVEAKKLLGFIKRRARRHEVTKDCVQVLTSPWSEIPRSTECRFYKPWTARKKLHPSSNLTLCRNSR